MTDSQHADFTPVPLRGRADGWTAARQRLFIEALRETRSVDRAVRAVGMSRASVYRLRDRPGAASFAAAWDAVFSLPPPATARVAASARAAADLWDRAVNGRAKPILRKGIEVGMRVRPDSVGALTLLRRFDRALARRDAALGQAHEKRVCHYLCHLSPAHDLATARIGSARKAPSAEGEG